MSNSNQINMDYRVAKDIAQRALPGIIIYPVIWPLLAIGSGFTESHKNLVIGITLILTVFSILRLWHYFRLKTLNNEQISTWTAFLYITILPKVAAWGAMFAYSLTLNNPLLQLMMAFSTAGIVAGGVNTFAPNRLLSFCFMLIFLTPPTIVSFFFTEHWMVGLMTVIYFFYMLALSKNQNREYWLSLQNETYLEKQSRTDSLTKLDNRRFFDEKLNELCHLSSRNHEELAILVIDCDHFKKINDEYGHDTGDLVLQHVASILKSSLPRATDVCARYGGEEFSALLPGTDLKGAVIVAERIRENIAANPLYHAGKMIKITVSVGITAHHINRFKDGLPRELFREADQALYTAKSRGRNRCISYEFEVE